ncbi:MAG TPA: 50S ribosomal protein L7/L12 [Candidatus Paceibacterota bacterium]|nr:50S ribosomal protein L7/L12 [Candidatus Paceibacterota bacterium]
MAEEKKLSEKLEKIIKEIEELSVLELNDLVKALEEKFGVSAMPVISNTGAANASQSDAGEAAQKETVSVILKDSGQSKLQVIKVVKDLLGLGLKESKDLVDAAPKPVKENISLAEAEEIKMKLEEAGASVEIK